MAKKTITTTEFLDDLDGSTAVGTVSFSYDGTSYEIDLSKKNKTTMDKTLKPYIDHARKVRATRKRRTSSGSASRQDLTAVREWAKQQGIDVSDRGRVSKQVLDAYNVAH